MGIDPVSLAITVALNAATMAMTMSQTIEGPRLQDLSVTVADYGTPINYFYGKRRLECPCFYAEPIKEKKKKRKTKGGKYNEYTYYGTWASLIADHEIEDVTRIWFDRHLAYDRTGSGPSYSSLVSGSIREIDPDNPATVIQATMQAVLIAVIGKNGSGVRIYPGSETQEPDPRMLATVEADEGEGTCPAYRGVAYAFFEDIPLEKVGNRLPQVSCEAVTAASDIYPYETFATAIAQPNRLWGFTFSPDYSRFMWGSDEYAIWDTAARAPMISGTWEVDLTLNTTFGLYNSGTILAVGEVFPPFPETQKLYAFGSNGFGFSIVHEFETVGTKQEAVRVIANGLGTEHWMTVPYSTNTTFFVDGNEKSMSVLTGTSWKPMFYFPDALGNIWAVGRQTGTGATTAYFYRLVTVESEGPGFISVTGLPAIGIALGNVAGCYGGGALVLAWWPVSGDDGLYRIDPVTGTVTSSRTDLAFDVYNVEKQLANLPGGASTIWLNNSEISLVDLSTVRTVTLSNWKSEDADGIIYDPINHALICAPTSTQVITFRYLDRISSDGVTLRSIIENVGNRVSLVAGTDIDAADLTQTVPGYSWSQGPAKEIIAPLLEIYDSDARPHDFQVEFLQRGNAAISTLATEYFVRQGDDVRYQVRITNDTDLPQRLFLNFADIDHDQQVNSAMSQRTTVAVDSKREMSLDMTSLALDKDTAQQLAERLMRRRWFAREITDFKLSALNLSLEPADVHTLELDGSEIISKAEKVKIGANGVIDTEWVRDHPLINVLSGSEGADMSGRVPAVVLTPGLTKGFVFDVPIFTDSQDSTNPFLYVAAAPYSDDVSWFGADFLHSDSGGADSYSAGWDAIEVGDAVTWGYCSTALGDAVHDVVDEGTALTVVMKYGTLTSITETEMLEDASLNLALVGSETNGWEIIQFQTATLTGTDTYDLSNIIRGARGTEDYIDSHAIGDSFILISNMIKTHSLGASEIGDTDYYKPISQGRDESTGFPFSVAFSAANLKPYSPAHVELERDSGTLDWEITWIRRTRLGAASIDGQDVPLGETSESYKVQIMNGSDVVRTITSTTETATYTQAQQVTDFGSAQATLSVRVLQVSPTLAIDGFYTAAAA